MNEMADAGSVERVLLQTAYQKQIPINGSLELTPLCNLHCEMCYVRLDPEEMKKQGSCHTASDWLSLAKEMKAAGTVFLLLTGGEPLLYPDFRELYLGLRKLGMILTVNTNGTLLDEAWADFFAENKPRRINLTLYGKDSATYERLCHNGKGFAAALRAVELLKERGVDVKLGGSVTGENLGDIRALYVLGEERGVPVHLDAYMYPIRSIDKRLSPEEAASVWLQDLKHSMKKEDVRNYRNMLLTETFRPGSSGFSCMAANCSFSISWQGKLRPCVMSAAPVVSVFETGFAAAWAALLQETAGIRLHPDCDICRYRMFCRICPAAAKAEAGAYDAKPAYLCALAEASYRLLKGEETDED